MRLVPGSSSQYSSRSLGVRSAVLPTDTKPLTPSEGPVNRASAASPRPPDRDTNARWPGGGKTWLKVALNRGSGPPLSSPMQLGPISRTPAAPPRWRNSPPTTTGLAPAAEQPHEVGPDKPHPRCPGAVAHLVLEDPALGAGLGEPGRDHAHRPDPQPAGLVNDPGHQPCGDGHHHQVWRLGARGQVRVGGHSLNNMMAGVDRVHRPSEPAGEQVAHQQGADAAEGVAGPHQGD